MALNQILRLNPSCARNVSALLILAISFAVYWQVGSHEFIDFDTDHAIVNNPHIADGVTPTGILWSLTDLGYYDYWHPLTWFTHMIDIDIYGFNAGGHLLTNALLHSINALLLFLLFYRLTNMLSCSIMTAAIFAAHPIHAESVAWLVERKDVLSTLFGLLSLHTYVSFRTRKSYSAYFGTLGLTTLGLMSKPILVMLPFFIAFTRFLADQIFSTARTK